MGFYLGISVVNVHHNVIQIICELIYPTSKLLKEALWSCSLLPFFFIYPVSVYRRRLKTIKARIFTNGYKTMCSVDVFFVSERQQSVKCLIKHSTSYRQFDGRKLWKTSWQTTNAKLYCDSELSHFTSTTEWMSKQNRKWTGKIASRGLFNKSKITILAMPTQSVKHFIARQLATSQLGSCVLEQIQTQ